MSVPFIEVGLHAGYEVLKRRQCSPRRVVPGSVAILQWYLDLLKNILTIDDCPPIIARVLPGGEDDPKEQQDHLACTFPWTSPPHLGDHLLRNILACRPARLLCPWWHWAGSQNEKLPEAWTWHRCLLESNTLSMTPSVDLAFMPDSQSKYKCNWHLLQDWYVHNEKGRLPFPSKIVSQCEEIIIRKN